MTESSGIKPHYDKMFSLNDKKDDTSVSVNRTPRFRASTQSLSPSRPVTQAAHPFREIHVKMKGSKLSSISLSRIFQALLNQP